LCEPARTVRLGGTPLGSAEEPAITFIGELKKQVGLAPVLFSEGQSTISDRTRVAHGQTRNARGLHQSKACPLDPAGFHF
jgi:hypothetical protein